MPLSIGADGVAGSHSEIRRQLAQAEPTDFQGFGRLAVGGFTGKDLAEVRGRDPVLVFAGETVVGNAKQRVKRDFDADLFAGFADGALLESLEKVHFAADNAPAPGFGRPLTERQEHAAAIVGQQNANADSGLKKFEHEDLTGLPLVRVREEWE